MLASDKGAYAIAENEDEEQAADADDGVVGSKRTCGTSAGNPEERREGQAGKNP